MNKKYMLHCINHNISQYYELDRNDLHQFNSFLQVVHIPKRKILYQAGEIHTSLSFITRGIMKAYIYDSKGNEIIFHFPKEDWWVGDISSFYFQKKALIQFESIEECEILSISIKGMNQLQHLNPKFEYAFHNLLKRYIDSFHERYQDHRVLSAKERYDKFLIEYPDLVLRVPLKQIASYLGVSPEFLSKLRKIK